MQELEHEKSFNGDSDAGLAGDAADSDRHRYGLAGCTDCGISAFTCTRPAVGPALPRSNSGVAVWPPMVAEHSDSPWAGASRRCAAIHARRRGHAFAGAVDEYILPARRGVGWTVAAVILVQDGALAMARLSRW